MINSFKKINAQYQIKKFNQELRDIYINKKDIDFDWFLKKLYNENFNLIFQATYKYEVDYIHIVNNFFPSNGFMGMIISDLFYEIDSIDEDEQELFFTNPSPKIESLLNTFLILMVHKVNPYKFNFNRDDIDDLVFVSSLYNTISKKIFTDDIELIYMLNKNTNIDKNLLFTINMELLDRDVDFENKIIIDNKYHKTNLLVNEIKEDINKNVKTNEDFLENLKEISESTKIPKNIYY